MTPRLLIIDDDEEMCEEMAEILRDEGYQVAAVFGGLEGLQRLEAETFDLLLLDLKIPGVPGFDILKYVKEQRHLASRIIVLTGRPLATQNIGEKDLAEKDEEERVLRLADGVINKPFDVDRVLAMIKRFTSGT